MRLAILRMASLPAAPDPGNETHRLSYAEVTHLALAHEVAHRTRKRGPVVRILAPPAIRLHHTSTSLGPSDRTKLDRCSRAMAGLAAGSMTGVATRRNRRAFGCGLVSRLSGRPNNRAQSRNFSARSTSCSPERDGAEAPASSCLWRAAFGFAVGVWDSFSRIKKGGYLLRRLSIRD